MKNGNDIKGIHVAGGHGQWKPVRTATGTPMSVYKGRRRTAPAAIFYGPSVDGTDQEYIKVVSVKVPDRKPSFAR